MRVGVYFTSEKSDGGVYQYSLSLLDALWKIRKHKYTIFSASKGIPKRYRLSKRFKVINLPSKKEDVFIHLRDSVTSLFPVFATYFFRLLDQLKLFETIKPILYLFQLKTIGIIDSENLEAIFFPAASNISFLVNTPSIVAIHDLQHRIRPQFKEATAWGRKEYRDYRYRNICKKAKRILVNSETGKEDVLNFYEVSPKKISVLPYLSPTYLNSRVSKKIIKMTTKKYSLPDRFFFYPSKFWPHKNHQNIVRAIKILKDKGITANLILTGSKKADFSSYDEVMELIKKLGLQEQIKHLGYLESDEFSSLYKMAEALIMPTYFGPTNIPIYEAWTMGTPVITSDLRGCREQVQDGSGLLVDPDDPKDMANKMKMILKNGNLKKKLITKGKKNARSWTLNDFSKKVDEIFKKL